MIPLSLRSMRLLMVTLVIVVSFVVYWTQQQATIQPSSSSSSDTETITLPDNWPPPETTRETVLSPIQQDVNDDESWWEELRQRICPQMVPDKEVTAKLFPLARLQLRNTNRPDYPLLNVTIIKEKMNTPVKRFARAFYSWTQPWGGMYRLSEKSVPGILFSLPKTYEVATNQLDVFWQEAFEHLPPSHDDDDDGDDERNRNSTTKMHRERFDKRLLATTGKNDTNPLKECMVIVVEDPIHRFLSAYNEIEYRIKKHKSRKKAILQWPTGEFEMYTEERFQQFLIDFLSFHGIEGSSHAQILELYLANSVTGVLSLLVQEMQTYHHLEREVHVLPATQNLEKELGPFIVKSCPQSFSDATKSKLLETQLNTNLGKHTTSSNPLGNYAAAKKVFQKNAPFARALCAMHLVDYACWPELPDGVPSICMEIYYSYYITGILWDKPFTLS